MSTPLSVLIMTMNEERNIPACLDSIVGWAPDIVVVDSGSTDRTIALCAERGVRTVTHPYADHRSQLRWSMASVPWHHDWLLVLDADNVVTPEFKHDVDRVLRADAGAVHGYYNPHHRYFRNRRVRGLRAEYLLLIRRSRVRVDDSELVDFRFIVDGPTGRLAGPIIESNQNELDIDFWIDKHQKFARRMAIEEILRREKLLAWSAELPPRLFGNREEQMIWLKNLWYGMPLYVRPVLLFVYRYFLRAGFIDGANGFVFHALQSFWFRLLVDVNIATYREKVRQGAVTLQDLFAIAGARSAETSSVAGRPRVPADRPK